MKNHSKTPIVSVDRSSGKDKKIFHFLKALHFGAISLSENGKRNIANRFQITVAELNDFIAQSGNLDTPKNINQLTLF